MSKDILPEDEVNPFFKGFAFAIVITVAMTVGVIIIVLLAKALISIWTW